MKSYFIKYITTPPRCQALPIMFWNIHNICMLLSRSVKNFYSWLSFFWLTDSRDKNLTIGKKTKKPRTINVLDFFVKGVLLVILRYRRQNYFDLKRTFSMSLRQSPSKSSILPASHSEAMSGLMGILAVAEIPNLAAVSGKALLPKSSVFLPQSGHWK